MPTKAMFLMLKQLFQRPFTNPFPVKYAPKNVTEVIKKVQRGEISINNPHIILEKLISTAIINNLGNVFCIE